MIAVKYSGKTLVAQSETATTTTAATRIISGGAPSGGGVNHSTMPAASAIRAIAGAIKVDRFSIVRRLSALIAVSMHRCGKDLCGEWLSGCIVLAGECKEGIVLRVRTFQQEFQTVKIVRSGDTFL